MICGALQTLNEEACEDVMDESVETKRRLSVTSNIQDPGELQPSSLILRDSLHDSHSRNTEPAASSESVSSDPIASSVSDLLSSHDVDTAQLKGEATLSIITLPNNMPES